MIESADAKGRRWSTIGVSPNIVDASYNALYDAITYKLFRDGASPAAELDLPPHRQRWGGAREAGGGVMIIIVDALPPPTHDPSVGL